jgi:hypothetical protein
MKTLYADLLGEPLKSEGAAVSVVVCGQFDRWLRHPFGHCER